MSAAKGFTYGMVVGAGVMFLMDPRQGGGRRALIRDKSLRALHEVEDAAAIGVRDISHRTEGLFARLFASGPRAATPAVLVERVRSVLGRVCSHPHAVHVVAKEDGCIELAGPILASDVERVLAAVSRVRGVETVDNDLEVHEAPGDVQGLQGEPLRHSRVLHISPAVKLVAGAAAAGVAVASLVAGHPTGLLVAGAGVLAIARDLNAHGARHRSLDRRHRPARDQHTARLRSGGEEPVQPMLPAIP